MDEPLPAAEPLAPPAAEPDFFSSSGAVVADEDEEPEPDGDEGVAVEPEPEVEPEPDIDPEPDAPPDEEGDEGFVALEPEVEPAPEGEVVVSPALSPQAVRTLAPNARETAIASVESLMCPPWLGYPCKSKDRAC